MLQAMRNTLDEYAPVVEVPSRSPSPSPDRASVRRAREDCALHPLACAFFLRVRFQHLQVPFVLQHLK